MIEHIRGKIEKSSPTYVVLDVNGVGYGMNVTIATYEAIEHFFQSNNGEDLPIKLLIHEVIHEDSYTLYGFYDESERDFFRLLISVSGVGPNTARIILSAHPISELKSAIMTDDAQMLSKIKGIGAKTAQRIIVELKDKVAKITDESQINIATSNNINKSEALSALEVLGFKKNDAQKALDKLFNDNPDLSVEIAVKQAIRLL